MSRLSGDPLIVRDAVTKITGDAVAQAALVAGNVALDADIQVMTVALAASAAGLLDVADGLVADATAMAALRLGHDGPLAQGTGSGATADVASYASMVTKGTTGLRTTTIVIDIAGYASEATLDDVIADTPAAANGHIGQITLAECGTIFAGVMECIEIPATGEIDIDLNADADGTIAGGADGANDTLLLARGANWAAGDRIVMTGVPAADDFLYLTVGTASTPTSGTYTTGIFVITFWGK